jgi:hypothetical protein
VSFLFPIRGSYTWKRVDKGQDFLTRPGTPLVAVVSGTLSVGSDPAGFGPRYPILHGDDGKSYYYGHVDLPAGMDGKRVSAGDTIARTSTTPRGNASQPGWLEFGDASLLGVGGETGGGAIAAQLHAAAGGGHHSGPGSIIGPIAGATLGPIAGAADAAASVVSGAVPGLPNAGDIAGGVVSALADALGIHASRILLYVVLVGAGVALAVLGVGRAAGVTGGDVRKAAAVGAAVA